MKRVFFGVFLALLFFTINLNVVLAQTATDSASSDGPSYSTCDQCGYCLGDQQKPKSWDDCRKCIYEGIDDAAIAADPNATLKINENERPEDAVITPVPGNYFTMLGCIRTKVSAGGEATTQGSVTALTQRILSILFQLAGGIAFLYILYGAYQVMTSQNNPERLNYGRRIIIGSIVGLIVSLSSVFLVNLIGNQILKAPGFGQ